MSLSKHVSKIALRGNNNRIFTQAVNQELTSLFSRMGGLILRRNKRLKLANYPIISLLHSPYCKPKWIGGYVGWSLSQPNANCCFIDDYFKDVEELIMSTRYEF